MKAFEHLGSKVSCTLYFVVMSYLGTFAPGRSWGQVSKSERARTELGRGRPLAPHIPRSFGWRIHCGREVTELSTNTQHTLCDSSEGVVNGIGYSIHNRVWVFGDESSSQKFARWPRGGIFIKENIQDT